MAQDDGPSGMSDLAGRLNVDSNYAGQYRLRLLAAELIESAGHGKVDFAGPYLRDYLHEYGGLEAQRGLSPTPSQAGIPPDRPGQPPGGQESGD